jgi:hypothetical protein
MSALKRNIGYWLGANRLYLQVTSRKPTGSLTLYHARGNGFKLPKDFVPIGIEEGDEPDAEELADYVEHAYETDERKLQAAKIGMGVSFIIYRNSLLSSFEELTK